MSAADKVLVVGPSWVGDMVMAQALYRLLRAADAERGASRLAPPWSLPCARAHARGARGIELAVGHGELGLGRRAARRCSLRAER